KGTSKVPRKKKQCCSLFFLSTLQLSPFPISSTIYREYFSTAIREVKNRASPLLSAYSSMGVPAFYRWLVSKYPKVVSNAIQDPSSDASSPNPNRIEFDNLYLDMNGIIHPCFHPEDLNGFQPSSFKDVFNSVFDYVDRLFNIVRPRKLLYFAIDGVAPRAKMNQQRARRFQAADNNKIAEEEEDRLRLKYEREGKKLLPKVKSELDDSNIITPGTEFMFELSKVLQGYIQIRLKENPAWKNLKVIISDSNVPGEGEHKIMSFIRSQRSLPGYDVNTRHCLHGLDADLIMLALATHELHFSILREDVLEKKYEQPNRTPTSYHNREASSSKPSGSCKSFPVKKTCSYQFLHIWILREYLELDMNASEAPEGFKFDIERAIDDFIFLCFFVGNDFLPHLPSLEINEVGALDLLMTVYKRDFKSLGGYIVDAQRINERKAPYLNLKRVERLVLAVGSYEEQIFKKRTELRERKMRRVLNELSASREEDVNDDVADIDIPIVNVALHLDSCGDEIDNMIENTKQMKEELKSVMLDKGDVFKAGLFSADKIKYGSHGWKERYYRVKFGTEDHCKLEVIKKGVLKEYTEGLCWVLLYYFCGVPSWNWFYPYHYGPCASDMKGLRQNRVNFQEGFPFEPFDQLMAVLPPRSAEALPMAFRVLMEDESSDLSLFYPQDFKVDMDGKRYLWQGRCILPFIDDKRLLSSTRKAKEKLKEYEIERNLIKNDLLFVRASSDFGSQLLMKIDEFSNGGRIDGFVILKVDTLDFKEEEEMTLCVDFALQIPKIYVPRVLENVEIPPRTVHESDIKETVLWHEQNGGFGRVQRFPNQSRNTGPQENEPNGLVGGSGWRGGRDRGFPTQQEAYTQYPPNGSPRHYSPSSRGFPSQQEAYTQYPPNGSPSHYSPSSRGFPSQQEAYTQYPPNGSPSHYSPSSGNAHFRPRPTTPYYPQRARPPPLGFRPMAPQPGFRPRVSNNMSNYPSQVNFEANEWLPRQFENVRVSGHEGRGFGRGRGGYPTTYHQGRGGTQFRPTQQCVDFALQIPKIYVPHILENVEIPPRTVHESDIKETVLWHEQNGGFGRVQRFPNQSRNTGPQENEPNGLERRKRQRISKPTRGLHSISSKWQPKALFSKLGKCALQASTDDSLLPSTGKAASTRIQTNGATTGFRPRVSNNMSNYPSQVNFEANEWLPRQFENVRVSGHQGRGFGRGRGGYPTTYYQGRGRGRGGAQFRPTQQ
ncbi:hypothetical protein V2J09_017031, partial [Rumex salicifolius]